jgi:hypothetical protein
MENNPDKNEEKSLKSTIILNDLKKIQKVKEICL